ncbi:MAG: hypothetical protein P9X24_19840, partial [Candidatus Hatepunaea meridiana]|nr:hypothetical protein [Candidatus Hatepunaea meridiana]
ELPSHFVIPAKAGIQSFQVFNKHHLDSRLRGNDKMGSISTGSSVRIEPQVKRADEIRAIAEERDRWIKVVSAFPFSPTTRN